MPYTIGLDWGGTAHAVCVMDAGGAVEVRRVDDALPAAGRRAA